jgi:Na+/H+ antiporter NhaD/arsenite permease-like protein
VALTGLTAIVIYKIAFTGFEYGSGVAGFIGRLNHDWVILVNLFLLLMGFALLAKHFEESRIPAILPKFLPDDWKGGFVLLVMICVLSSFLDNIAAALVGGTIAAVVFKGRVHIGYLAAIVAASNAGGAGSVVGDTTTTMMWIEGVHPISVIHAYVASAVALVIFGIPAAMQQQRYSPITADTPPGIRVDWHRVGIVALILLAAIVTNIIVNVKFADVSDSFPFIGVAVWIAILIAAPLRGPEWSLMPGAFRGSIFLLSLVLCASMMPVKTLPSASWHVALTLGFVSAVFDNIPLTALALTQGGYDWGVLAYAVGFGGSMIWFGSSAGVALSGLFPEAKSVGRWLKSGWHVTLAYVIGFFVLLTVLGWRPVPLHKTVNAGPMHHSAAVSPR